MTENNIENIRRNAISEIKEKIKKLRLEGRNYTHPCNKERQKDQKMLKFSNGCEYTYWMQQNGILKSPTNINTIYRENSIKKSGYDSHKEYRDMCAQRLGFRNDAHKQRERDHNNGKQLPMEFNEDCSSYFGIYIAENYIMKTFEDPIKMPYGNPGYDWLCKTGKKIECKSICLSNHNGCIGYGFNIYYNNIADYFILSAWDNRDSLEPLHIWIFHRNDIIRGAPFWNRNSFWITNIPNYLTIFSAYEVKDKLEKLKEYIKEFKKENDI